MTFGEEEGIHDFYDDTWKRRDFLKNLGISGVNITHSIFYKWAWRLWAVLVWLTHGDETLGL
jgi:hypothetical protein